MTSEPTNADLVEMLRAAFEGGFGYGLQRGLHGKCMPDKTLAFARFMSVDTPVDTFLAWSNASRDAAVAELKASLSASESRATELGLCINALSEQITDRDERNKIVLAKLEASEARVKVLVEALERCVAILERLDTLPRDRFSALDQARLALAQVKESR
jgi:hypothetical protein